MALWWIKTCLFKNPAQCKLSKTSLFPLPCVALTLSWATELPICWGGKGFREVSCPRPQSGVQRCWGLSEAPHRTGVPLSTLTWGGPFPDQTMTVERGTRSTGEGRGVSTKRLSASSQSDLASLRSALFQVIGPKEVPSPHPILGPASSNKSLPMHFYPAGLCGCGSRWPGTALSQSQRIGHF